MKQALSKALFWIALILVAAFLLFHSQMYAYVGDESFHLLAAKLISAGKRPYADFFYQHPPLFIYLVAGIIRIAGASWRAVHVFSALSLIGAIVFAACYARDLFPEERFGWLNAALMPLLIGMNCYVLVFATTGLPFGFCLLCLMAALYFSRSKTSAGLLATGVFAGASAAASFLTIPALVVLLFHLGRRERLKTLWFVTGVTFAFTPLLLLLIVAPHATVLDVIKYHLFDRPNLGWRYNLREIVGWFATLQGAMLTLPAIAAMWWRKDDEVRLCGWIALVLIVSIAAAKTTATFYFLVATPFLAILAGTALTEAAQRFRGGKVIVPLVLSLYFVGLLGLNYVWRWEAPYADHNSIQRVVLKIDSCAPVGEFYAPEAVYFEAHRLPLRGMENRFDPFFKGEQLLEAGRFSAVVIGPTNPAVKKVDLFQRYAGSEVVDFEGSGLVIFCPKEIAAGVGDK